MFCGQIPLSEFEIPCQERGKRKKRRKESCEKRMSATINYGQNARYFIFYATKDYLHYVSVENCQIEPQGT
jgi:hypothetical protein